MTLKDLEIGESAQVCKIGGNGELRQHFLDMGIIPGTVITKIKLAPMGDPIEFDVNGYELTLRLSDAEKIEVEKVADNSPVQASSNNQKSQINATTENNFPPQPENKTLHPGLGEDGKFHAKDDGNPLPDDTVLTYALVGN